MKHHSLICLNGLVGIPSIWGNDRTALGMFCEPKAFGERFDSEYPYADQEELTLLDIADHWHGVANRIEKYGAGTPPESLEFVATDERGAWRRPSKLRRVWQFRQKHRG